MFTPSRPLWETRVVFGCSAVRSLAEELVWSVRGLWQHAHQGTLVAERVRQRPGCAAESWEYWPATGATAALPICTGVRHVVEEVHLSGGFVLINSIGFNMVSFVRPVRKGRGSIPISNTGGMSFFTCYKRGMYESWNFNSGNYLFTTDTK